MGSALYAQYARGYNPLTQAQGVIDFQRGQTALGQERFNLQQAQLQPAYAGLNALLENPNATWNDINAALANSARLGGDVSGLVQNASDFAAQPGPNNTPADFIRQYGTARYAPPFEASEMFLPRGQEIQGPGGTYYGLMSSPASANPGQFTPRQFMPTGMNMQEWMTPMPDPKTGQVMPMGQVYGLPFPGGGYGGMGGEVGMGAGPATGAGAGGANIPGSGALGMIKQQALMNVMMRESGGQNIPNAQGSPAQGYFQIIPQSWQEGAALAGVDTKQYPNPMSAPFAVQQAVASALYDRHGTAPWAASAANAGRFPGAEAAMLAANGPFAPSGGGAAGGSLQVLSPYGPGGPTFATPPSAGGTAPTITPGMAAEIPASVGAYQEAERNNASLWQRQTPLLNAINILQSNPNLQTGMGEQDLNTFRQLGANIGKALGLDIPALDSANGFAEVGKALAQYVRQAPGANRSDLATLEAQASNPDNKTQQREAVMNLLVKSIGTERLNAAGYDYFNSQYPNLDAAVNDSGSYRRKVIPWLKNMDPTAFALDEMTPAIFSDYVKSLGPQTSPAFKRFRQSWQQAKSLYGITLPWLQNQGGSTAPAPGAPLAAASAATGGGGG